MPDEEVSLTGPVQLLIPETADDLTPEQLTASGDAQVLRAIELLGTP